MSRPSVSEISALCADLAVYSKTQNQSYAELMTRKADLLERIAASTPDNVETAEVARIARERANALSSTD
ncbi:hypothetical protein [Streptomyces sp. NPDC059256]|uniref:hypothetical protein n=1 Tax=Streptomyces sp. NPDC059256 TaxID=3346794 RepID=UPI0036743433